jgi:hypothetical protein
MPYIIALITLTKALRVNDQTISSIVIAVSLNQDYYSKPPKNGISTYPSPL